MGPTWGYRWNGEKVEGLIFPDAIPDGWRDTPAKCGPTEVAPEPEAEAVDEKDALIERAKALGLKANRRFSVESLREMIEEAGHGDRS